ncbi:MAG: sigma-70 family RNA polymerase sigma factor [Lachnospiraceae bacterium]|nr:sigma-70 family RNA polymerase sigma factor [Lachnospiraceae bacterium]
MKIGEKNYSQQLQLHNEKALMYVIDEYGGLLMAVIRKHLFGLPGRQEECFDDVLLKIWQNISHFDESKNSFKNWAAAIARYQSIDYLRQYQRELATVNLDDTVIVKEDNMLAGMIEDEISEEVEKMLRYLKPQDRELFLKLYVEEKTVEQVSEETGMKKEMIYNRLSRGKHKIRRQFRAERGV